MAASNNPAGRLLAVVEVLAGGNQQAPTKDVLGAALKVAPTDTTRFYSSTGGGVGTAAGSGYARGISSTASSGSR